MRKQGPQGDVLALQRAAGNRAVSELIGGGDGCRDGGLSDVRIHTGPHAEASARAQDAVAYATGRDVYLGRDVDLTTDLGQRVLAHELTHVVQQERGRAGIPLASAASLEGEASAVSGVGAVGGSGAEGAAAPGAVQRITEAELQEEWRRLHPPKPGAFRSANPFEIEGGPAEREAYKAWREQRLRELSAASAAKVQPWTEEQEARRRAAAKEEAAPGRFTDIEGRPVQGPITLVPSESFIPVAQPAAPAPPQPRKRNLAAEAKAAWEAKTSPREKAEAAKRPPLSRFVSEHDRAVIAFMEALEIAPGWKLGRNIAEFISGEDVLGRKLSRRAVSREISKEVLLNVAPLLIPEGGLIGEGGSEAPVLEQGIGESAPTLEGETGGLGGLGHETVTDLPSSPPAVKSEVIPSSESAEIPKEVTSQPGTVETVPESSEVLQPAETEELGDPGRRARRAASREGIEKRKKLGVERLKNEEYDPFRDVLDADEREAFERTGELPKEKKIRMHHTQQSSADPGMADVPEHIQPTTPEEHAGEHSRNPADVPTAGIRRDVTSPENPIYDPNAPEVQTQRANPREPTGEPTWGDVGKSEREIPKRAPPNFRDVGKVRDPALTSKYDYQIKTKAGIYRREIESGKWIFFPK